MNGAAADSLNHAVSMDGHPLRHPTPGPGTPGSVGGPMTPQQQGPAAMSPPNHAPSTPGAASNHNHGNDNPASNQPHSNHTDLASDLNFDPEAIIDGEGTGQEGLDVSILEEWTALLYTYSEQTR